MADLYSNYIHDTGRDLAHYRTKGSRNGISRTPGYRAIGDIAKGPTELSNGPKYPVKGKGSQSNIASRNADKEERANKPEEEYVQVEQNTNERVKPGTRTAEEILDQYGLGSHNRREQEALASLGLTRSRRQQAVLDSMGIDTSNATRGQSSSGNARKPRKEANHSQRAGRSKKTLKRYKKSQKGKPEFLGTGATGRFVNTVNKDIETRGIQSPSRTTINPSEDTFTDRVRARSNARREARRVYNADVIEKENAKKAIEETTHRHNTNSRSGGRIKPAVGDVRSNTEDPAIASARNSFQNAMNDAINNAPRNGPRAGHSTSSHSSNRMLSRRSVSKFSTFPNRCRRIIV